MPSRCRNRYISAGFTNRSPQTAFEQPVDKLRKVISYCLMVVQAFVSERDVVASSSTCMPLKRPLMCRGSGGGRL